jgi:hypothetical protein
MEFIRMAEKSETGKIHNLTPNGQALEYVNTGFTLGA